MDDLEHLKKVVSVKQHLDKVVEVSRQMTGLCEKLSKDLHLYLLHLQMSEELTSRLTQEERRKIADNVVPIRPPDYEDTDEPEDIA
jgi:hypothetical protein|tara:strand:+ start:1524 stop:1781 length:258 start_codon:yes stop_codon:yes gene_type:complete